ncbi:21093_t:CDS:1, partial [Racocetra persica]
SKPTLTLKYQQEPPNNTTTSKQLGISKQINNQYNYTTLVKAKHEKQQPY